MPTTNHYDLTRTAEALEAWDRACAKGLDISLRSSALGIPAGSVAAEACGAIDAAETAVVVAFAADVPDGQTRFAILRGTGIRAAVNAWRSVEVAS